MKQLMILMMALFLAAPVALADAALAEAAAGKSVSVRTFQFKHKSAEQAAAAIKSLRGAEGSVSITNGALVVTDSPENLKKIAATLAEFDVAPQQFRLNIRLVSAARAGAGQPGRIADEVRDLAPKLALLRYNVLDNVGAADVVGSEGEAGLIDLDRFRADFKLGEYDASSDSVKLEDLKVSRLEGDQLSQLMKTTLNLKLGQTVILGVTRDVNSGRALMIVLSAKR
jgi:Bacterial type II/III secretion system short domain